MALVMGTVLGIGTRQILKLRELPIPLQTAPVCEPGTLHPSYPFPGATSPLPGPWDAAAGRRKPGNSSRPLYLVPRRPRSPTTGEEFGPTSATEKRDPLGMAHILWFMPFLL